MLFMHFAVVWMEMKDVFLHAFVWFKKKKKISKSSLICSQMVLLSFNAEL